MKQKKLPAWLTLTLAAAVILLNAVIVLLIFRIEGKAFPAVLLLYAAGLSTVCAWLLRRRDLKRLSAELGISEAEVLQMIKTAKKRKK